jgi:YVTN family beta-propeller protein
MKCFLFVTAILYTAIGSLTAQNAASSQIINTFHVKSGGGWDYLAVCPKTNRLYVSHGTQVNILDKTTGDSLGIIQNTTGVHGIAFLPSLGRGYTSNGKLNNVFVFDLKTDTILAKISTGENPDAIMYEPFSKMMVTCNGKSKDLSVIDPIKNTVIATIPIGGKPETAVSDENGRLFVNNEDKNEIDVVDMKTFKVIHQWSIAPGEAPTGLAIDLQTKRLFAGCEKLLVVVDANNGKIIEKLPIGDRCDGVAFDKSSKKIFTSNGEGTMTIIEEKSAKQFKVLKTVPTKKGARTICLDEATHTIYLPTADFEPLPANSDATKVRPKMIAGTFQVLVVKP